MALRLAGEVALATGDAGAEGSLEAARALAERLGMRPLACECHIGLAEARRRAGDREGAERHRRAAAAIVESTGMRAAGPATGAAGSA
jgi:hypothetical protein